MRFTVAALAALIVALFAAGSAAGGTPVGHVATRAAACGDRGIDGEYLSRITHRHGITCKRAKRVERRAARAGDQLCQQTTTFHAWTVTYAGPFPAFSWDFQRGDKSFHYDEQGGC
jgi:hypothetical protein